MQKQQRILLAILISGWVLRVIFALLAPVDYDLLGGGDARWYLANSLALVSGMRAGISMGFPVDVSVLPTAPLYLLFIGFFVKNFPLDVALVLIRLIQTIMGITTCYFAYDTMRRITQRESIALVTAALLAFSPAFILEPSDILTELSYIFYVMGGIWAFVRAMNPPLDWRWLLASAIFLALATLTRAVSLLFPVGLTGLIIVILARKNWKQSLIAALFFLGVYSAIASTWTLYNALVYDRLVIGSDQLMPSIWRGAIEGDSSPQANDEILGEDTPAEQTAVIITADPSGYVQRRMVELTKSYLQPHGTLGFGSESLRKMAQDWVKSGFSAAGFWQLITGEGFWPKLIIYIWHFGGLLFGIIGMGIMLRKNWQMSLALIGFIVYTTLLHLVILALPRYIFPALIIYWMFAAVALVHLWDWWQSRKN